MDSHHAVTKRGICMSNTLSRYVCAVSVYLVGWNPGTRSVRRKSEFSVHVCVHTTKTIWRDVIVLTDLTTEKRLCSGVLGHRWYCKLQRHLIAHRTLGWPSPIALWGVQSHVYVIRICVTFWVESQSDVGSCRMLKQNSRRKWKKSLLLKGIGMR